MADKDITLRIRAKDYSKQTIDALTKTIDKLSRSMNDQRDAAKKGEATVKDLEAGYLELEKAAKAVVRQAADVKSFQNQAKALDATRKAAIEAANAQVTFQSKLSQQDKVTKAQAAELSKLTTARNRADKALQTQSDRLQKMGEKLASYGISVNGTEQSLVRLGRQVEVANQALAKQDEAILSNEQHLKALAAAQKAAEDRELADNLRRQQEELRAVAQQQLAVANGWTSAAASARAMSGAVKPLSEQIRDIVDPSRQATTSLEGINEVATRIQKQVEKTRRPIAEFGEKVKELRQATQSVTALGQLADSFRQQVEAVRGARQEYTAARQKVVELTQALTQNGANTKQVTNDLRTAQAVLKGASENFNQLSAAARASQQQLRAAGIDTRNLQQEEQRLLETARNVTGATNTLTEAYKKNGAAGEKAGKGLGMFNDGGKTALSLVQRVRGEILSLTAAYGGVYGAINLANSAINASIVKQQTLAALAVSVGKDTRKQGAEWEYVNKVADYFGANLEELAKSYGKFSAASFGAGMKQDQTKELFENITSIGTAYGKTSDQMNLVYLAVEQMLSKGSIQAEEFKNQFGEQIPGAYEAGAKALGLTTLEFKTQMQNGVLGADAVITIMRGLAKDSQAAAEQMKNGIVATQNAMKNAQFRFNIALSDSGFLDAYTQLLTKMTTLLSGPQGRELANNLGAAFSGLADIAKFLADNLDLVKWALANIAFAKAIQYGASLGSSFKSLGKGAMDAAGFLTGMADKLVLYSARMGTATVATRILAGAMKGLARAIPILGTILIALDIGSVLYNQSETVKKIVDGMVKYAVVTFQYLKNFLAGENADFAALMKDYEGKANLTATLTTKVNNLQSDLKGAGAGDDFKRTTSDGGFDAEANREKEFNKKMDKLKEQLAKQGLAADKRVAKDNLQERLRLVRESYSEQLKTAQKYGGDTLKKVQAIIATAEANERDRYKADHAKKGSGGTDKKANLVSSTMTDLEQAESRVQKKQTFQDPNTSFGEREAAAVKAAVDQYKDLENRIAKIAKFDKDGAAAMQKRVDVMKSQTTEATSQQIALAEIDRLQKQMSATTAQRQSQEEQINALYQAGKISETEKVERLNALYDESAQKVLANVDALRQFAMAHQAAMDPEAFNALMLSLDTMQTKMENVQHVTEAFYTQLVSGMLNGVDTAFKSVTDNLAAVVAGTESWGDAMANLGTTMLQFFADLLRELAMAILKTMILKALQTYAGAGGVMGSVGTAAAGMATQNHGGGMAGNPGGRSRMISPSAFMGAPKYHSGGIAGGPANPVASGLQPNEVPSILQKGEEVLTRGDPRHVMNGGKNGGGPSSLKLIAVDDQRTAVAEALKTPEGQQAMIVSMRSQLPTLKKMIQS